MISSTSNAQVKEIVQLTKKAKLRREQKVFLVEGVRMFSELPAKDIQKTFVSMGFLEDKELEGLLKEKQVPYEMVTDAVFAHMSDTCSPQGILCVVRQPAYGLADLLQGERTHLLLLENIQDPGNLGTMFRVGEGAGVTGIVMNTGCVDLFSPKTIRSTMGSIFRVPFYVAESLEEAVRRCRQEQVAVYAAHLGGETYYDAFDYRKATGFLIGNEGNGLTDGLAALADAYVKIPMEGRVESLNAAMAAGLLMYEVHRQRQGAAYG